MATDSSLRNDLWSEPLFECWEPKTSDGGLFAPEPHRDGLYVYLEEEIIAMQPNPRPMQRQPRPGTEEFLNDGRKRITRKRIQ